jgi:hypothetical protein
MDKPAEFKVHIASFSEAFRSAARPMVRCLRCLVLGGVVSVMAKSVIRVPLMAMSVIRVSLMAKSVITMHVML